MSLPGAPENPAPAPSLDAIRERLDAGTGREHWRSLEQLAGSPEVAQTLRAQYPSLAERFEDPKGRRDFLRLMGASLGLAGLTACTRQPLEQILPYARYPENLIPGKPRFYATTLTLGGFGTGLLVESHMGRPTKIEGNPEHPASLGSTNALAQAEVLDLYDPDRAQVVRRAGRISTWGVFQTELSAVLDQQRASRGAGLRLLCGRVSSPSLHASLEEFRRQFPRATWHQWEPVHRDAARAGALEAFGEDVALQVDFEGAERVLSVGADFLGSPTYPVSWSRAFAKRRAARQESHAQNRMYVVESAPTVTGASADHRLGVRPSATPKILLAVAKALAVPQVATAAAPALDEKETRFVRALARDLERHGGRSAVLVGDSEDPVTHAIGHAVNARLGNFGRTVQTTRRPEAKPIDCSRSLRQLVEDMERQQVEALIVLGGNPVYDAPADLPFAQALENVPFRAHLSLHENETSRKCHWHLPEAHWLESWGDARGHDGTLSVVQPLIAPLYDGKSALELVAAIAGTPNASGHELVRAHWAEVLGEELDTPAYEKAWRRVLHDGRLADSAFEAFTPALGSTVDTRQIQPLATGLELCLRADPCIYDGRFANNGWLQELPKPVTRLTWDNAVHVAPQTAERLGLTNGRVVQVADDKHLVHGPVWIVPGQPEDTLTLHLGYGRRAVGRVGRETGFDAYPLRRADEAWRRGEVFLTKRDETRALACTQDHHSMEGRDPVRVKHVDRFKKRGGAGHEGNGEGAGEHGGGGHGDHHPSLLEPSPRGENAWGMVIDLSACSGCNACVVACQAENNIPIVGREEVLNGREMHWIRVDRYFEGDPAAPSTHHQPLPCMHCEKAPCEVVCPVNATVHGPEGLNEMVYNRCVGTRYCANNCPYKVRRFNFFHYSDYDTESLAMLRNPDVTVRSRGVMEKCTYCVQRINEARITAKKEGRPIRDGEVRTACQSVCPSEAIHFGNLEDPESDVAHLREEPHHYGLLEELNTAPRTTYLEKVLNPNPELAPPAPEDGEEAH